MRLSDDDLDTIQKRSSNLFERLTGKFLPGERDDKLAMRRLTRWREVSTGNDPDNFTNLLCAVGIVEPVEATLLKLLGPVRRHSQAHVPPWATFLREIVSFVSETFALHVDAAGAKSNLHRISYRVPYENLYWPIAELARSKVLKDLPGSSTALDSEAWRGLQRSLIRRVASVCSEALHTSFLAYRSMRSSGMSERFFGAFDSAVAAGNQRRQYTDFIAEKGLDGMRLFFIRFPVAARLVAEITLAWIEFVGEFLQRFEDDRELLSNHFNGCLPIGRISAIKAGISDPHNRGRSVLILTFDSGLQLVYKPRPMEIDRLFFDLVGKLNAESSDLRLRILKVLDRGSYGWMEFVRAAPCRDERAARRFYRRAGALAYLLQWLEGIDCHFENLVAAGEHPILIDLESLAHPPRPEEDPLSSGRSIPWAYPVLRSGLLPLWQARPRNLSRFDHSALGASIIQRSFFPAVRWMNINTDQMKQKVDWLRRTHRGHRPRLGRHTLTALAFEHEIVAGYRRMAAILEGSRCSAFVPLRDRIFGSTRRYVKRPTLFYATISLRSLKPENLSEGVDRSIELQAIPFETGAEDERTKEIASLETLDIPYFQLTQQSQRERPLSPAQVPAAALARCENIVRLSVRRQMWLNQDHICRIKSQRRNKTSE